MSLFGILTLGAAVGSLAGWAVRDHRAQVMRRRRLLDDCTKLFDAHTLSHGGDGFPRIRGTRDGRNLDVQLLSDGMTIRRLPQLWMQITELDALPIGGNGFAVLVRPSGYEFFSLTDGFHHIIEVPGSFPDECIVRGESAGAEHVFGQLVAPLSATLADPRVKEIAVTRNGLRIIRQVDEGRAGDYLLLRQAAFERSDIPGAVFLDMLQRLRLLRAAFDGRGPM